MTLTCRTEMFILFCFSVYLFSANSQSDYVIICARFTSLSLLCLRTVSVSLGAYPPFMRISRNDNINHNIEEIVCHFVLFLETKTANEKNNAMMNLSFAK